MILAVERSDAAAYLGVAAGVTLLMWLTVVALLAVATRTRQPETQSAGLELGGEEPPAVVNLLTHGWKVRGEALSATLVDLAARHILGFEQDGDGRFVCRVLGDGTGLTSYERQIYKLVADRATAGVVPFEALTIGTGTNVASFQRRFDKAVVADARQRGLSRSRWTPATVVLIGALAVAPAVLASGAFVTLPDSNQSSSSNDNPVGAFIGLAFFAWAALMAGFRWLRSERDTTEGLNVAGRWLGLRGNLLSDGTFPDLPPTAVAIWDRYLAFAVALSVAVNTERSLPLGAESDTEAWSSVGGRWRVVRIHYPRHVPPGWGGPPWKNVFVGVVSVAAAVTVAAVALPAINDADADSIGLAAMGLLAFVLAVVAARGLWTLGIGAADLGRSRAIEGRVLRVRTKNKRTYVAVDDGTTDHIAAWVTNAPVVQGAHVHAQVATHVGFARSITADRGGPAPSREPSVADLFNGPAAAGATPVSLDPQQMSTLVGIPLQPADGARLQGPDGLAIGALRVPSGASVAFELINRLPGRRRESGDEVGDESAWIDPISALAARRGDHGVLVFARGGSLDEARRRAIAASIARELLSSP